MVTIPIRGYSPVPAFCRINAGPRAPTATKYHQGVGETELPLVVIE